MIVDQSGKVTGDCCYSQMTFSAHTTSDTKMAGLAKLACLPARSVSRTPRA